MPTVPHADRIRLAEKLMHTYFLGEDPAAAASLVEWLAREYLVLPEIGAKAIDSLLCIARQFWVESKTEHALPILEQALTIAKTINLVHECSYINLQRVRYLHVLGRSAEARILLETIPELSEQDDSMLQFMYYREKGVVASLRGESEQAYQNFEQALKICKKRGDPFHITTVWVQYASAALTLGDTLLAENGYLSAILIAREHQMTWRISYLLTSYANLLVIMGRYSDAREHLMEALAYEAHAPVLELLMAKVGIPLALYLDDTALLRRCEQFETLKRTLQPKSGLDAPLVAALAQLYDSRGKPQLAARLLHRALAHAQEMGYAWEFPLAIARYGRQHDIPAARAMFEQRLKLSSDEVTYACLSLFNAFVARRNTDLDNARIHAEEGLKRFKRLGWNGYADLAHTLLPGAKKVSAVTAVEDRKPFFDKFPTLTLREQQVAELVLRGFTNRTIAAKLSIAEHTVESHMSAIMGRLGVRSRYQLPEKLAGTQEE